MKRYEAYRPTKYEWLTEVPTHWQTRTMRSLTTVSSERRGNREATLLSVYREYGVIVKSSRDDNHNVESEDLSNYKWVRTGDLVMNKMKMWQGSLGVSEFDGIVSPAYIVCHINDENVNRRYLHMLLRSPCYKTYYNQFSYGIRVGQWDMHYEDFKGLEVALPPREEQDQIVRYLDWQVSKINRLIAAKRKEIDAIHDMEHLYIDHVFSEIENQKTIRLKYLVEQFVDCPHETPEYCKDGDYCVIRTADQDYGCLRSETLMYRLTESEYTNRIRRAPLNAGDIVYGREGERWGLACVIPESEKFCLGQRIMQFVCNKQMVTPEYVMWALNSSYVRNQGILDTMGSTSPHVNISTIINFRIPYTSREHQDTLVSKIECTMQKYRQLCERIENEIQLLHDLRTRLISNVVTGQVDVRGIKVPDDEYINNEITEEEFEEESENNGEE